MTIIFDFDGTIADSFPFIMQYLAAAAGREPLSVEEQLAFRKLSMVSVARRLGISRLRLPSVFLRGRRAMGRLERHVEPFEGMPELIRELHESGNQLMILSSNRSRNIHAFLRHHKLEHCFSRVYGQVGLFGKAPVLRRIVRTFRLQLGHCLYIGDEMRDIEAAQSMGMPCMAVMWGFANPDHIAALKPRAVAATPAQLAASIRSFAKQQ